MSKELDRLKSPYCPECGFDLEFILKRKIKGKAYNEYKYKCTNERCTYEESLLGTGARDKKVTEEAITEAQGFFPKNKLQETNTELLSFEEEDEIELSEKIEDIEDDE